METKDMNGGQNSNGNGAVKVTLEHIADQLVDLKGGLGKLDGKIDKLDAKLDTKVSDLWGGVNSAKNFCAEHSRTTDSRVAVLEERTKTQTQSINGVDTALHGVELDGAHAKGSASMGMFIAMFVVAMIGAAMAVLAYFHPLVAATPPTH